ncbi:RodZ domain-containing protein [Thalassomonas sp. RHCl1]|uniref:RodZ domain-containing protein n=1 Tax=Thalassomonas sp. RHCl1 TaxID=2995320 RepID=UPI00248CF7A3|nr:RodZ domain-containing protein [Thalassomonas sp. RHCl1]
MSDENTASELSEDMEVIGPGQMLAEARIQMGLSQEQVADKLNFRPGLVRDIEAEIFDKSLPTTFNRGYLRNYAKLVNISVEQVLASYEMLGVAEAQGAELQSFSKITKKQAETNLVMWISYLVIALLIGSTVMWWLQDVKDEDNSLNLPEKAPIETPKAEVVAQSASGISQANESETAAKPLTASAEPGEGAQPFAGGQEIAGQEPSAAQAEPAVGEVKEEIPAQVAEQVESAEREVAQLDAGDSAAASVDETRELAAEQIPEQANPMSTAVFTFSGDCYVNIFDATGERIAYGLKKSGYVMTISGVAPLNITIGRPDLVAINFDGQEVDMSNYPGSNIAKFNLPMNPPGP